MIEGYSKLEFGWKRVRVKNEDEKSFEAWMFSFGLKFDGIHADTEVFMDMKH